MAAVQQHTPSASGRWPSTQEERNMNAVSELMGGVRVALESSSTRPYDGRQVKTVEIQGQPYRLPSRIPKEFYRDLTFLEDEEVIRKYRLEPCSIEDYWAGQRTAREAKRRSTTVSDSSKREARRSRHA